MLSQRCTKLVWIQYFIFSSEQVDHCGGCQHGGHCVGYGYRYMCSCPSGYTGAHCERKKWSY